MKSGKTRALYEQIQRIIGEDTMPGAVTDNEDTKSIDTSDDCEDDDSCEEDQLTAPENQSDEEVEMEEPEDEEPEEKPVKETMSNGKTADDILTIMARRDPNANRTVSKVVTYALQLSKEEQTKLLQGLRKHLN